MSKAEATKRGKALLAKMKGKGWKLRVSDDCMGNWHYTLYNHGMSVYEHGYGRYWTLLADDAKATHSYGLPLWTMSEKMFKDPNLAVRAQLDKAREYYRQIKDVIEGLDSLLSKGK